MKLPEKIVTLRKGRGLSQEALAEQLGVSRQAVSRWEQGSAQPDAGNLFQLSRLFQVSADYLLDDALDQPPQPAASPAADPLRKRRLAGILLAAAGLLGNLVIYILSRAVAVMVPVITYEQGVTWYNWSSNHTGHSWKFFIQTYDLELLTALFCLLLAGGVLLFLASWPPLRARMSRCFHH